MNDEEQKHYDELMVKRGKEFAERYKTVCDLYERRFDGWI